MADSEPKATAGQAAPPSAAATAEAGEPQSQQHQQEQPNDAGTDADGRMKKTDEGSSDEKNVPDAPERDQGAGGPSIPPKDEPTASSEARAAEPPSTAQETTPDAAVAANDEKQSGEDGIAAAEKEAPPPPAPKSHDESDSFSIGPSDANALAGAVSSSPADGPVCNITLLLPTGARHPYKIDDRYLSKRGVEVPETTEAGRKDPFSISVYKLKELILREWREEWEGKPASPSSIRLIHFGKLLEDKEQLKKYQFSAESPNVVHMSVRPAEMMEEDEAGKSKSGGREGRSRDGSSNCCVIL